MSKKNRVKNARRFFFKLLCGLLTACLLLLALEGGTRLLPLDSWEQGAPNTSYPLFLPGDGNQADRYFINGHFQGIIAPTSLSRVKAAGVTRVFVVGGSAARGWPWPGQAAFTGYMQRALDALLPGKFEVVNIGAMSYGSHRVLDLLADVVKAEPDLVIIWSGNNEYVERNVLAPLARTAPMREVHRALRYSSLYRAMRFSLYRIVPGWFVRPVGEDITDPRVIPNVRRGNLGRSEKVDREVLNNYQDNLRAMIRMIKDSGARPILCTVPVNLSQWVPSSPQPLIADPAAKARWNELLDLSLLHYEQRRFAEAIPVLQELLAMTPYFSVAYFTLGECYRSLGDLDAAKKAFDRARDLDEKPIRAFSAFEEILHSVARKGNVPLVDLERRFQNASGVEMMGLDLFLDYVHPNEAGNKLAAMTLLEAILPDFAGSSLLPRLKHHVELDSWLANNIFNQADIYYVLGMTYQNNGDYAQAENAYLKSLQINPSYPEPAGNLAVIYDELGKLNKAEKFLRMAITSDSGSVHKLNLAILLYRQGKRGEAEELARQLLGQGLIDGKLFALAGHFAFDQGAFAEALDYYRKARDAGVETPEMKKKLEDIYRALGDSAGGAVNARDGARVEQGPATK